VHEIRLGEQHIRWRHPELIGDASVRKIPRHLSRFWHLGDVPLRVFAQTERVARGGLE
jgi:hypothetical protein